MIPSRDLVPEWQRARLTAAAVLATDELGYRHATVSEIVRRAGVSRGTFYGLFDDRDSCLAAAIDGLVETISQELTTSGPAAEDWLSRVRNGLWTILSTFDREPALARVCIVESAGGGRQLLSRREQALTVPIAVLDEGRQQDGCPSCTGPETAEILVRGVLELLRSRLLFDRDASATEPFEELLGAILLPYLGPAVAERERARPRPPTQAPSSSATLESDPLTETGTRLTYRTVRVLETIAGNPGANSRAIAERAGISDPGQVSRLLSRLEGYGLIVGGDARTPKWAAKSWSLTVRGEALLRKLLAGPAASGGSSSRRPTTSRL